MIIYPSELPVAKLQGYLQGLVSPRPIAFVSSIDGAGNVNLSPFSFFNLFSMNPPVLVFSPSRRVRDNSTKHTLQNVEEVPEVTINVVTFNMVQQTSLASCEFPKGVSEFVKAGFTEKKSQQVKPPMVAESPASFECSVKQIIPLGTQGGAGNLVVCEILLMHIHDDVIDSGGRIDPFKLDTVARMGNNFYCRVQRENIFEVPKPNEKLGIGFDQLPEPIRLSPVLTGNDLGQLANIEQIPIKEDLTEGFASREIEDARKEGTIGLHRLAQGYIRKGKILDAWKVLLSKQS
jgi:flavin reductase (DIM6/NTAB) family NADH-FMN oxidoreductase RutF